MTLSKILRIFAFDWSIARSIRNLKISAYYQFLVVAVPAYSSISFFASQHFQIAPIIPVNLVATYFSALFFFIGVIIFDICCPRIIKRNNSKYSFIQDCITYTEITVKHKKDARESLNKALREILDVTDPGSTNIDIEPALAAQLFEISEHELRNVWESKKKARQVRLRAAQAAFYGAFAIAAYLTVIDAPCRVMKALGSGHPVCDFLQF